MAHVNYIVTRRCKIDAICGSVNLPYGTSVILKDGFLFTEDGRRLCARKSRNGHDHFNHNDDGMGEVRGHLVHSIINALSLFAPTQEGLNIRNAVWAKVWEDPVCLRFKDPRHDDFWLWDTSFYDAEIEELKYINHLVGGRYNV